MKLKFDANQQYQLDAIDAVVDVFAGQPNESSVADFDVVGYTKQLALENVSARGNQLFLTVGQIVKNIHRIQNINRIELSKTELIPNHEARGFGWHYKYGLYDDNKTILSNGMNFSIEMETGTGKTYVYLRTIHELHKKYGWKKFIIVVPSVAIREGVLKNLEITRDHFAELYENPEMNYYVWDSKKTGQAREFATNDTLQIMVITIDSFAKAKNVINQQSDFGKPVEFIRATNPIVIVDEPQNMETDIRKQAIESLNPLCTLRYSATHKFQYNLLYRLTPVDAYDKNLVKKIEVHSVLSDDSYNDAYMSLIKIEHETKGRLVAHLELDKSDEYGLQRKVVKAYSGDDLAELTGRSIYDGFVIDLVSASDQSIEFSNGKTIYVGQKNETLGEEILKRQIELAVEDHFEKQKALLNEKVKVLSLFFIDKVANYREYSAGGVTKGKFAKWFEEAYEKVGANPKFAGVLDNLTADEVHNGYFAADKNGQWKDSRDTKGEGGRTKDDDGVYSLIMKDKERLLNYDEPLRFIFSHSALREGWDNPNVFVICTLNETSSEMKKRQEIGRGLRLPVNANGERIHDRDVNILTVVANESYADFSRKLQTEIEDETGISFAGRIKNRQARREIKVRKNLKLDENFKLLWDKIKHKTIYKVQFDEEKLIEVSIKQLSEVSVFRSQIIDIKTIIKRMKNEFKVSEKIGDSLATTATSVLVPDVLQIIQSRTGITRKLIFEIFDRANAFGKIAKNPQQMIDETVAVIKRAKRLTMVDGIKYEKTGEHYDMSLFENEEFTRFAYDLASKTGAVKVDEIEKTVYDHVSVDSEVEYDFLQSLEQTKNVKFYIKLLDWFKIDTPLGSYNPDWAVAFDGDERVYFVAETKGTNNLFDNQISDDERAKIISSRRHFEEINVKYIAPVEGLRDAISGVTRSE